MAGLRTIFVWLFATALLFMPFASPARVYGDNLPVGSAERILSRSFYASFHRTASASAGRSASLTRRAVAAPPVAAAVLSLRQQLAPAKVFRTGAGGGADETPSVALLSPTPPSASWDGLPCAPRRGPPAPLARRTRAASSLSSPRDPPAILPSSAA